MDREKLLKLVGGLCVANFVAYVIIAIMIGGDAINGRAEGGHYFLANHGKLTEVSAAMFTYSRLHTFSLIVTHPMAILCGFLLRK